MTSNYNSVSSVHKLFLESTGICTDTRKIIKGNIYLALKGANFNGNLFAEKAIDMGASYAIVDEKNSDNPKCLLVEDGLKFLQDLANYHRKQFNIPFIGITGSNGKTTTKELVSSVLKKKYRTHFTYGNLNNHIGVPLTLLSMPSDTEIAVIEMGANKIGDIAELCSIAEPTHGLITNIGKAHLEGFGSIEGVAKGKSELFDSLQKSGGQVFINAMSQQLMAMSSKFPNALIYSKSDKDAYLFADLKSTQPFLNFNLNDKIGETHLVGEYNFDNILAALCIGKFFGVDEAKSLEAVCEYIPSNNRSQIIEKGDKKLILDAYNANPSSMDGAVKNFANTPHSKKVVILGDMFELGESANEEHRNLYHLVMNQEFKHSFFVGKHFKSAIPNSSHIFETKDELIKSLKSSDLSGSLILIKGSRGVGLETILEEI